MYIASIWSGTHWKEDSTREIERLAQQVVEEIDREADLISDPKTKAAVRAWAKKSGDRARLVSMVNLAGTDPTIACLSTNFDDVPGLLPVLNGVVDLRSGALLPHDSSRLIGKLVEHEYHRTKKGARFEAVLSRALPNKDVQRLFQRSLGYALHGDPVEQRFFVVQGRGANSKSLLFDTAAEIVRAWVVKTPTATFLQKDNEPNTRPDLVRLQGSRIVIGSEVPNRRKLDATIVKVLTGDSDVTARPLYFAEKTFRRTFVPYMITNPLPPGDEVRPAFCSCLDVEEWRIAAKIALCDILSSDGFLDPAQQVALPGLIRADDGSDIAINWDNDVRVPITAEIFPGPFLGFRMRLPKDVVVKGLIDPRIRAFELHHSPKPPPTLSPLHNQMIARCK